MRWASMQGIRQQCAPQPLTQAGCGTGVEPHRPGAAQTAQGYGRTAEGCGWVRAPLDRSAHWKHLELLHELHRMARG